MRSLLQCGGPARRRRAAPTRKARARCAHCRIGLVRRCVGKRPQIGRLGLDVGQQPVERGTLAEFDATRVPPLRCEEIAGQWNSCVMGLIRPGDEIGRTLQQRLHRHAIIGSLRHEGRVGAVLQQPPDQIGKQVAMAADRRIGAVGEVGVILGKLLIERFAHAVQALEFEASVRRQRAPARSRPSARCGWRIAGRCAAAARAASRRRRRNSDPSSPCA